MISNVIVEIQSAKWKYKKKLFVSLAFSVYFLELPVITKDTVLSDMQIYSYIGNQFSALSCL